MKPSEIAERLAVIVTLAWEVACDYEHYVDNDHDDSCGDYPTCRHTEKWDRARKLKELCQGGCDGK